MGFTGRFISEETFTDAAQLPLAFELPYTSSEIDERMTYAVSAAIRDIEGKLLYRSDSVHAVLTRGSGNAIDIELVAIN